MNIQQDLWIFNKIYDKYSTRFMNIQQDLWIFNKIYEYSTGFMNIFNRIYEYSTGFMNIFNRIYEYSTGFMNIQQDLWIFNRIYEYSTGFMNIFNRIYEYSTGFMNIQQNLWIFKKIYEYSTGFMNIQQDLWIFNRIYEYSTGWSTNNMEQKYWNRQHVQHEPVERSRTKLPRSVLRRCVHLRQVDLSDTHPRWRLHICHPAANLQPAGSPRPWSVHPFLNPTPNYPRKKHGWNKLCVRLFVSAKGWTWICRSKHEYRTTRGFLIIFIQRPETQCIHPLDRGVYRNTS